MNEPAQIIDPKNEATPGEDPAGKMGTVVPIPEVLTALTFQEENDLAEYEATIAQHIEGALLCADALAAIRDRKLYRKTHKTFENYCQARWQFSARRARQILLAHETAQIAGAEPGTPESHLRPLVGLPPEQIKAVWTEATKTAPGGRITAAHVKATREKRQNMGTVVPISQPPSPQLPPPKLPASRPPIDAGSREEQLKAEAKEAIAKVQKLIDNLGTADSAAVAELPGTVQTLERVVDHIERKIKRFKA